MGVPMYTDPIQWKRIRKLMRDGGTIRGIARTEHLSRKIVRKMLMLDHPPEFNRRQRSSITDGYREAVVASLSEEEKKPGAARGNIAEIFRRFQGEAEYRGSYSTFLRLCRSLQTPEIKLMTRLEGGREAAGVIAIEAAPKIYRLSIWVPQEESGRISLQVCRSPRQERARETAEWIDSLRGGRVDRSSLQDQQDLEKLLAMVDDGRKRIRNRALVVLAHRQGFSIRRISFALSLSRNTCKRYLQVCADGDLEALAAPMVKRTRLAENEELQAAVFRLLHEPPFDHGFNRASWTMPELGSALATRGLRASVHVLREIIHQAGWKWKKARIALTSQDPEYRAKLAAVQEVLSKLTEEEAFFSIDEFGPFAVKMKQGRVLTPPATQRVIPQWQKSKGCMIMTAALELQGNQVTHFYSEKKNTAEMIKMMEVLLEQYPTRRRLYLSWDAASWHISKALRSRIDEHNSTAEMRGEPCVELAPLPSGAQFLNVIESVFSGMARAVIHNSNYQSVAETQQAIDRYFSERNNHYRNHPKRAGKRIWGAERVPPIFLDSNNCKEPLWR